MRLEGPLQESSVVWPSQDCCISCSVHVVLNAMRLSSMDRIDADHVVSTFIGIDMKMGTFTKYTFRFGKWTLIGVITLLAGRHWGLVDLDHLTLAGLSFVDLLYMYLLLNGLSATPFLYLEARARMRKGTCCPQCGRILRFTGYECPKCGEIQYVKREGDV